MENSREICEHFKDFLKMLPRIYLTDHLGKIKGRFASNFKRNVSKVTWYTVQGRV